jgi:hypothetical protein
VEEPPIDEVIDQVFASSPGTTGASTAAGPDATPEPAVPA